MRAYALVMISHNKAKKIDFWVIHTGMVYFFVTSLGCSNLNYSLMINLILHNKLMTHLCKKFHMPEYTTSNHALFADIFCSPEVIHVPCNIMGYHLVRPPVGGHFGFRPFLSVAASICGHFGFWPFRFVVILVCGRFGLWPFRLWPFRFVAVMICCHIYHICLHYWVVIWVAGHLILPYIAQFMGYVIGRIHYGLKVVFCFRQFTAYHCHHNWRVLRGIENM